MIHRIAATDPRLDAYCHVGDPAWLLRHQLFVAEGRLVLERLLASPGSDVHSILVTPAALDALDTQLQQIGCDVYVCDRQVVEGVTGFDFHRGCLALARRPPARSVDALVAARRIVALEGVGNPDNVGGIFRTAAALGAGGVVLDPTTADPLYRKAIRTSMAATLRLLWVRLHSWPHGLTAFQSAGFRLVALTPDCEAVPLETFASTIRDSDRLLLLLGAEGPGLSDATQRLADARVRIPIDPGVDSLNVVVAAGVALYCLRGD